jgi:hypothetical protein
MGGHAREAGTPEAMIRKEIRMADFRTNGKMVHAGMIHTVQATMPNTGIGMNMAALRLKRTTTKTIGMNPVTRTMMSTITKALTLVKKMMTMKIRGITGLADATPTETINTPPRVLTMRTGLRTGDWVGTMDDSAETTRKDTTNSIPEAGVPKDTKAAVAAGAEVQIVMEATLTIRKDITSTLLPEIQDVRVVAIPAAPLTED